MVDESEVLTPADPFFHIAKNDFTIPFVCGATNLGEAIRRIHEGAAMIRTKGEAGTGNVVAAVTHSRIIQQEIAQVQAMDDEKLDIAVDIIMDRYYELSETSPLLGDVCTTPFGDLDDEFHANMKNILLQVKEMGRLPVITFSAGGIATPADAALMMKHGMDGIFVGSGIFKSPDPKTTADAIIMATHHFDDPAVVSEASAMMGEAMPGLELEGLATRMEDRGA
jgi:pyridoxal 5'-phosphate synthase pdxS subunit